MMSPLNTRSKRRLTCLENGVFQSKRPTSEPFPRTMVPKKALMRREKNIVGPLSRGSDQPERFLGEDAVSGRRMGVIGDLRNGTLPLGRSVQISVATVPRAQITHQGLFCACRVETEQADSYVRV